MNLDFTQSQNFDFLLDKDNEFYSKTVDTVFKTTFMLRSMIGQILCKLDFGTKHVYSEESFNKAFEETLNETLPTHIKDYAKGIFESNTQTHLLTLLSLFVFLLPSKIKIQIKEFRKINELLDSEIPEDQKAFSLADISSALNIKTFTLRRRIASLNLVEKSDNKLKNQKLLLTKSEVKKLLVDIQEKPDSYGLPDKSELTLEITGESSFTNFQKSFKEFSNQLKEEISLSEGFSMRAQDKSEEAVVELINSRVDKIKEFDRVIDVVYEKYINQLEDNNFQTEFTPTDLLKIIFTPQSNLIKKDILEKLRTEFNFSVAGNHVGKTKQNIPAPKKPIKANS